MVEAKQTNIYGSVMRPDSRLKCEEGNDKSTYFTTFCSHITIL